MHVVSSITLPPVMVIVEFKPSGCSLSPLEDVTVILLFKVIVLLLRENIFPSKDPPDIIT